MATRLFLRDLTAASPPTAGEHSTALPNSSPSNANSGAGFEDRALKTTKGVAQTSKTIDRGVVKAHRDNYVCRFTSDALAAQTISANTWTIALACREDNDQTNAFIIASIYVWRPGTSAVVGFIYDSHTSLGVELNQPGEDGQVVTVSGGSVVAQSGDVLVYECWFHDLSNTTAINQILRVWFDGTTDVVDSTTTDAASYIETPQNLSFGASVAGSQATETDTANPGSVRSQITGSQAAETDLAQAGSPRVALPGTQAVEVDTAQAGSPRTIIPGSQGTEADEAFGGTPAIRILGSMAVEDEEARAGVPTITIFGSMAIEADEGFGGDVASSVIGSQATETDLTGPGTPLVTVVGVMALETDLAAPGALLVTIQGAMALELDEALAGLVVGGLVIRDVLWTVGGPLALWSTSGPTAPWRVGIAKRYRTGTPGA